MSILVDGQVGPRKVADGTENPIRMCNTGEQAVSNAHPIYYEPTVRRTVFSGSITGQATTIGLATTYTGLCLSNPIGGNFNLVITKIGFAFIVAFAAGSTIGLMTGYNNATNVTHTTPVTPRCQYFTSASGSVGLLDSAATLPTAPTLNVVLGAGLTGAITTATVVAPTIVDLDGSIILPPGAYCAFYTSTASGAAGGAFSFQWEEVPI